ncbi:MAG: YraN family protein [Firmicutes bacterium]|jgi:putative endonuclease|nr:YraN family protein [Bacillota bacterium]NLL08022.1 YraN family protein [Bacillota bacterium]HBG09950.1 YraN family protein [Bacillota bacterium]
MNGGRHWEALARKFLVSQGLRFVEANFARRFGEIDLIMQDGTTLIFVEVKYRSSERFGSSLEQVTPGKIRKIKLAAQAYLQSREPEVEAVRFDVVGISPEGTGYKFNWVKGAFQ